MAEYLHNTGGPADCIHEHVKYLGTLYICRLYRTMVVMGVISATLTDPQVSHMNKVKYLGTLYVSYIVGVTRPLVNSNLKIRSSSSSQVCEVTTLA